jgi:hypothetical protein
VSRALLGSEVEASIDLTGQRLQAKVQVGGQAMESLRTLAFDLTAMLTSLEGGAGVPAFLVHDSPREADLGESVYHRLFRFAVSLESLSEQLPFNTSLRRLLIRRRRFSHRTAWCRSCRVLRSTIAYSAVTWAERGAVYGWAWIAARPVAPARRRRSERQRDWLPARGPQWTR